LKHLDAFKHLLYSAKLLGMFGKPSSSSRTNGIALRESGFDVPAFLKNVESLFEKQQASLKDLLDERLERHKADILETVSAGSRDGGFHGDGDHHVPSENLYFKRANSFGSSSRLSSFSSSRSFPLTEAHLKTISDRHNAASLGSTPKSTYSTSSAANSCGSESGSRRSRGKDGGVLTPVVAVIDCITPDSTHLAHPWTELDEEYIKPLSEEMDKAMGSVDHIVKFATPDMIYMR
jgi:hypothetical protein